MSLVNKMNKLFSVILTLFCVNAFASDIPIDNVVINDQGDSPYGGQNYAIDKMLVNWDSQDQITVDIYTHFGSHNNQHYPAYSAKKVIYGDLLLGTEGANSDYNYAFSLGHLLDGRYSNSTLNWLGSHKYRHYERYYSHDDNANDTYSSGGLYAISDTLTSTDYHNNGDVKQGEVFADINYRDPKAANGTWSVKNSSTDFDILSFSFNVANIDAFKNASQLSLSWAMSCFNDSVHGTIVKAKDNLNQIPLPATSLLMLLALTIVIARQQNRPKLARFIA